MGLVQFIKLIIAMQVLALVVNGVLTMFFPMTIEVVLGVQGVVFVITLVTPVWGAIFDWWMGW